VPTGYAFDRGVLQVTFEGRHTLEEDMVALSAAFKSPEFVNGTSLLLDIRGSRAEFPPENIMSLALFMREGRERLRYPSAILVSSPLQYEAAWMLIRYARALGLRFDVFSDVAQARRRLRPEESWVGRT